MEILETREETLVQEVQVEIHLIWDFLLHQVVLYKEKIYLKQIKRSKVG